MSFQRVRKIQGEWAVLEVEEGTAWMKRVIKYQIMLLSFLKYDVDVFCYRSLLIHLLL